MWPLMDVSDLIGASWLPTDGQASPSDITQSLAKGARMHGARIVEGVRVTGFRMAGNRITHVETDQGPDRLRQGGELRRHVGAARSAPWQASTCRCTRSSTSTSSPKRSPASRPTPRRCATLTGAPISRKRSAVSSWAAMNPNPQGWVTGDIPKNWEFRLFDDDYDHFAQHMEQAIARVPALADSRRQADDQRCRKLHARRQLHPRPCARMREHVSSARASTPSASQAAAGRAGCWPNG